MVDYAAAFSVHPDAGVAAGEAIGALLEQLPDPTAVVVMASGEASWRLADFVEAADALLSPEVLVGLSAQAVRGNGSPLSTNALAIWACDGAGIRPVRLEADTENPDDFQLTVGDDKSLEPDEQLLLFCDPDTVDADVLLAWRPDLRLCAGFLAGVHTGGLHRLFVGQDEFDDGAVGLALSDDVADLLLVRGVRQIGDYWTVTGVDAADPHHGVVLGGRPMAERADAVGVRPDRVVLGSVTLDQNGEAIFVPPSVGVRPMDQPAPVVGELCALWAYDSQVFGPGMVTSHDLLGSTSHVGFGPANHQLDPAGTLDGVAVTTSHQIGSFLGQRSIFVDAFAAAVLR